MREVPVIVEIHPHRVFLELLVRRRVDGTHVNSMKIESGRTFVLIETHVLRHLTYGGEDAQTGVAIDQSLFASRVALIRIEVVIAVGRSRVPKTVTAVGEVQYAACVHFEVTFQMSFHLKRYI